MRVKFFSTLSDQNRMEELVNEWLIKESEEVEVLHILQNVGSNEGYNKILVSIWYKRKKTGEMLA